MSKLKVWWGVVYLYRLNVPPHKLLIGYEGGKSSFTAGEVHRHHLHLVIWVNTRSALMEILGRSTASSIVSARRTTRIYSWGIITQTWTESWSTNNRSGLCKTGEILGVKDKRKTFSRLKDTTANVTWDADVIGTTGKMPEEEAAVTRTFVSWRGGFCCVVEENVLVCVKYTRRVSGDVCQVDGCQVADCQIARNQFLWISLSTF